MKWQRKWKRSRAVQVDVEAFHQWGDNVDLYIRENSDGSCTLIRGTPLFGLDPFGRPVDPEQYYPKYAPTFPTLDAAKAAVILLLG